jgi:DNA repair protein RadC
MGGRIPVNGDSLTCGASNQSCHSRQRIHDAHDRPLLFADSGVRVGRVPAHPAGDQTRALSVLASLLTPFAAGRAEHVAKALLSRFGTLERALSASDELLLHVLSFDQETGRLIAAAKALVLASLQQTVTRAAVDPDSAPLHTYLIVKFRGKSNEELYAIFVDSELGFISEDLVSVGSKGHVDARISSILRRGLELGAAGFLLVHNHPSQSPSPSASDVWATKQTMTLSRSIGIELIDHLIVAGNRVTSMKGLQLI